MRELEWLRYFSGGNTTKGPTVGHLSLHTNFTIEIQMLQSQEFKPERFPYGKIHQRKAFIFFSSDHSFQYAGYVGTDRLPFFKMNKRKLSIFRL